ncbi:MAG: putative sulfate exporter family transporter [Dehalococcoidia bacterium]|nr:putative sulfate exporter family transporter [Dehalococcoidia bacterium]
MTTRPHEAQARQHRPAEVIPGLLLCLVLALASFVTYWVLKGTWVKFSALLWAFLYGIAVANLVPTLAAGRFAAGVEFSGSRLLRISIALLGLTISASVWARMGAVGVVVVLVNLILTFVLGSLFCRYVLRMTGTLSVLLGVGTCICGATAIAATGPALHAREEELGLSVAAITLFGLAAMFAYPLLFAGMLGSWLGQSAAAYGIWTGMGVHETAQVIAAASQVDGAVGMAVSAKSIRIFMIGPMIFVSQLLYHRLSSKPGEVAAVKFPIPWFAVAFVLFTVVNAAVERLPFAREWTSFNDVFLKPAVTFLLVWAFVAVGLKVRISAIRAVGLKAFLGGMTIALAAGGSALLLTKYAWLPFNR